MADIIDRSKLSGLIPEPVTREIIQGAVTESAVLRMARRLPNMTSKTQTLNVLDALPTAYFVNGEAATGASDSKASLKKTTNMAWDKKKIYAEEIAVIVPIPEAVLGDSDYDIWGEVRPRLQEAFGKVIDAAVLYGTDKPASWREGLVPSAETAGAVVTATADIFKDIMGEGGVIAKVEESGYIPNGVMAAIQMRAKLRGLVDKNGQPIFKTDMQGDTRYALDGMSMYFPVNGAYDPEESLAIVGDWSQLVYAIRQDMTFKIFDSGVVQDPTTGNILYNLMQNDMVALRAVMRLGWEIPNPINAYNAGNESAFPFAVYAPAGGMSARLSGLTIGALALTPAFDPDTAEYTANTTNATNTITATPEDEKAAVTILNGETPVNNGAAATWAEGANTVTITVKNGTAQKVYTVTVTKST